MQHSNTAGCILLKFYIKPQPSFSGSCLALCCILSKFYIKPQPDELAAIDFLVVSYRNSTSNHNQKFNVLAEGYVVSYRNSTSNHNSNPNCSGRLPCCILSKFYIKPQRCRDQRRNRWVVSYRNSTSNHNRVCGYSSGRRVVSYRNSTSNHNGGARRTVEIGLYLIEILHQTTTL